MCGLLLQKHVRLWAFTRPRIVYCTYSTFVLGNNTCVRLLDIQHTEHYAGNRSGVGTSHASAAHSTKEHKHLFDLFKTPSLGTSCVMSGAGAMKPQGHGSLERFGGTVADVITVTGVFFRAAVRGIFGSDSWGDNVALSLPSTLIRGPEWGVT